MSMNWKCRFGGAVPAFRGCRSCVSPRPSGHFQQPPLRLRVYVCKGTTLPLRFTNKREDFFYFRSSALLSLVLQRCSVAVLQFSRSISQTLKTVLSLYIYYIYNIYIKIGVIFDLRTTCFGTATLQHCNALSACACLRQVPLTPETAGGAGHRAAWRSWLRCPSWCSVCR